MAQMQFLIKVLSLSLVFSITESSKFCIGSNFSNLTTNCNIADNLQDINDYNDSKVEIYLCSSEFNITTEASFKFTDLLSFAIIGVASESHLNCDNKTSGFYFTNVSSIEIRNATISRCAFQIKSNKSTINIADSANIGNFSFAVGVHNDTALASNFQIVEDLPRSFIPGKETELKVTNKLPMSLPVFIVRLKDPSKNISVDKDYVVTNSKTKLLGIPNTTGTLEVVLLNKQDMVMKLSFDIILEQCPPGYVHDENTEECLCSANTESHYLGIQACNATEHRAYLDGSIWAGYFSTDKTFRTTFCPLGYCNTSKILLPYSTKIFHNAACNEYREGIICGLCMEDTSVFYHTENTFDCKPDKHCHLGILLFIISEILPVTILFLVIIFFDIQLTTGAVNGFLFYMQIYSSLYINENISNSLPDKAKVLLTSLGFIARMFNLNFFTLSGLSFCLFKKAKPLDVLVFDYVIVIYSLLLIVSTVILMNLGCQKNKHFQRLNRGKPFFSRSIIHGLSGFLVMCYARSTTASLRLLTPGTLLGKDYKRWERRVFYYGDMEYFDTPHLPYAIPALFALVLMTILPPIFLLAYPLCYKVLALFRLQESLFAKLLCKAIPLEKFKPFFDSFQGTFKDDHRYFSSLYFLYRSFPLAIFALPISYISYLSILEGMLIGMLALHAWVYPYKKIWHNRLDVYIFTLLIFLNGVTLYRKYPQPQYQKDKRHIAAALSVFQVLSAYTPLVVMIVYIIVKLKMKTLLKYLKEKFQNKRREEITEFRLSVSMLDQDRDIPNMNYQKIN